MCRFLTYKWSLSKLMSFGVVFLDLMRGGVLLIENDGFNQFSTQSRVGACRRYKMLALVSVFGCHVAWERATEIKWVLPNQFLRNHAWGRVADIKCWRSYQFLASGCVGACYRYKMMVFKSIWTQSRVGACRRYKMMIFVSAFGVMVRGSVIPIRNDDFQIEQVGKTWQGREEML